MKRAIISLATDRGNYYKGLCRLGESLRGKFSGDFLGFMGEGSIGAPKHEDNPYAFKVHAFKHVFEMGYEQIIWLDSSVYAIKPVDNLFEFIERDGYVAQEAGHVVSSWCDQKTYNYFNLTPEKAAEMIMYGNAGFLGLDMNHSIAEAFFSGWRKACENGIFKGDWANFRHDMTCGSIIANNLGWKFQPGNQILQYAAPTDKPNNDTICFFAQGL